MGNRKITHRPNRSFDPDTNTKCCVMCAERKDIALFYKEKRSSGGVQGTCISCTNDVQKLKRRQPEVRKKRNAYLRVRQKTEAEIEWRRRYKVIYRMKYREKEKARLMVSRRIRAGLISPPETCEICGVNPGVDRVGRSLIQAHHDDYAMPLNIRWLCQPCHVGIHNPHIYMENNNVSTDLS